MEAWKWLGGGAIVLAVVAALYGLHRLGLWLEQRGWLYYRKKRPDGGAATCLVPLHQFVEPAVRHVVEVKHGAQNRARRERLLAELVARLTEGPVDVEQVRRLLETAREAGLDWRGLYQEAVQSLRTSRPDIPDLPPPDAVGPP
jgi:hypothetical protein